jgi:carboxyl-terminal processing protease
MTSAFKKFQLVLFTFLLAGSTFFGGLYLGKRGYEVDIKRTPPQVKFVNKAPSTQVVDFSLFWDAWDQVSQDYLNRPVDPKKMMYGAVKGMVESLGDPYTSFLDPDVNKMVNNSLNGAYEGVGMELGIKDGQLIVVAPLDGSPAKSAGILSGDRIFEIEGKSTSGITVTEAVSKIRGQAGTVSTLKIQRGNGDPFVLTVKREKITVASVTWQDKGQGTAYIRISRFGADTNGDWDNAVKEVDAKMSELDVIILDLRGNPGGYLQSAVHIASDFYTGKPVLFEETALKEQLPYNAQGSADFARIPVIILLDEGSASASEILASALKENVDAVLVGTQSFGKGTIQDAKEFKDGSGLHITIAKWLTSQKKWVGDKDADGKIGLKPDVPVEITADDINASKDPQLDKALELANKY